MTEQIKSECAACPKCGHMPAEYKQKGGTLRWFCQNCGSSGPVQPLVPAAKAKGTEPTVHKHWSDRR